MPKSPEEIEEFKKDYPDVYGVVETVSRLQADAKAVELEAPSITDPLRVNFVFINKGASFSIANILYFVSLETKELLS